MKSSRSVAIGDSVSSGMVGGTRVGLGSPGGAGPRLV
jgi:hypothetical protein